MDDNSWMALPAAASMPVGVWAPVRLAVLLAGLDPLASGALPAIVGLALLSCYLAIVGRTLAVYSRAKLDDYLEKRVSAERRPQVASRLSRTLDLDESLVLSASALRAASNLVLAALSVYVVGDIAHPGLWVGLALFVVGADIFPKAIAAAFADSLLWHFGTMFRWTLTPFLPLGWAVLGLRRFLGRAFGREALPTEEEELEDRLRSLVSEGESEGVIEEETQDIIRSAFEMHDQRVNEIMTPRTDLFFLEADLSLEEAVARAHASGHSRIPVYEGTRDNVVGIFYAKDVLAYWDQSRRNGVALKDILRKPVYVPETGRVDDLLVQMRRGRTHMAIVTDEYGGTAGVVTVEDALEELVGEILDEYDTTRDEPSFQMIDACTLVSDGRVHLDEIGEALGVDLPADEDVVTLGGFITSHLGRIPVSGESFTCEGIEVSVLEADERKVVRARLTRETHRAQVPVREGQPETRGAQPAMRDDAHDRPGAKT